MSNGRHRAPARRVATRSLLARTAPGARLHRLASESRQARWAVVAAPLATAAIVVAGTVAVDLEAPPEGSSAVSFGPVDAATSIGSLGSTLERLAASGAERTRAPSRTARRAPLAERAERGAGEVRTQRRWTTVDLNVWTGPGEDTRLVTVLDAGDRVRFTGVEKGIWAQVVHDGKVRYVKAEYLVADRAEARAAVEAAEASAASGAPCPHGSSIESGLGANAVKVYRAICAAFPDITSYGGYRGDGMHAQGRAVDAMVSGDRGWEVAEWVRARAGELGVSEVIYAQRIWTVDRAGEGWRPMEDRGSATANHYDHVHVTTY